MDKEQLSVDLHARGLVKFGDFILKSKQWSPVYFNLRPLGSTDKRSILNADEQLLVRDRILSCYAKTLERFDDISWPDHMIGVPEGGLTLTAMLGQYASRSVLQMRVKEKEDGQSVGIEGDFYENELVVVVDDVLSTGISVANFVPILAEKGLITRGVCVLIDREQGGKETLEASGVEVESAIRATEIYDILHYTKRITDDEHSLVTAYQRGEITSRLS